MAIKVFVNILSWNSHFAYFFPKRKYIEKNDKNYCKCEKIRKLFIYQDLAKVVVHWISEKADKIFEKISKNIAGNSNKNFVLNLNLVKLLVSNQLKLPEIDGTTNIPCFMICFLILFISLFIDIFIGLFIYCINEVYER